MTEIIVTAIITALTTVLIMLGAIASAAAAENNEKDNSKKIEELESKIKLLELNIKLSIDQNNESINFAYKSFRTNIEHLIERVEKLENKNTTKKK